MVLNIEKLLVVNDDTSRDYLRKAYEIAWKFGEDKATKTGAILVKKSGPVVSLGIDYIACYGYNHLTPGVKDIAEWKERPLKYSATVHAEIDAITTAAKFGKCIGDSVMYMPWIPCPPCYIAMKNAGIKKLVAHKEMIEMSPLHWEEDLNKTLFLAEKDNFEIVLYSGKIGGVKSLFNGQEWEP